MKNSSSPTTAASRLYHLVCLACLTASISACAQKPWLDPLAEEPYDSAVQLYEYMGARDRGCGKTMEADLALFLTSPMGNKSINGFFQFSHPSSFKFVITNPFGQAMWAVSGNQEYYQSVDTRSRQYTAGGIDSFGIRNKVPAPLLLGDWWDWLTAQSSYPTEHIIDIRDDRESRGLWITLQTNEVEGSRDHLLVDPEKLQIQKRIISDEQENDLVTIEYNDFHPYGACSQPLTVDISGLDYGVSIRLQLENLELLQQQSTYTIPNPPGYFQKLLP